MYHVLYISNNHFLDQTKGDNTYRTFNNLYPELPHIPYGMPSTMHVIINFYCLVKFQRPQIGAELNLDNI